MKNILKAYMEAPNKTNERAFENALKTQALFYNPDLKITIENEVYIPIFTSVEDAQAFGIETQVVMLSDLRIDEGTRIVINPNDASFELSALDVDTILGADLETVILGEDNKSLSLMMELKHTFDAIESITKAWLVRVEIGRHGLTYLVLDGIDPTDECFDVILQTMEPYHHTHDVMLASDKDGKTLIQGIKPFYSK